MNILVACVIGLLASAFVEMQVIAFGGELPLLGGGGWSVTSVSLWTFLVVTPFAYTIITIFTDHRR